MSVAELLAALSEKGIELWTEGGKLRFRAPTGALTPDLRSRLVERREEVIAAVRERARQSHKTLAPSYSQLGMWLVHQVAPDSAAYNVSFSARVCSAVDVPALRQALQALLDRHATLRTAYTMRDGQPLQQIQGYRDVDFEQVDVVGCDDASLYQQVTAAYRQPFDLEAGAVMRVRLFTRASEDHILLLVVHHIALDGWSMWLLLDELRVLYPAYKNGEALSLPRPEVEYSDYARWQSEMIAGPEGERLWSYWKQQLAGEIPSLDLPTDYPRSPLVSYRGSSELFELDEAITGRIKDLAKAEGVTLYVLLLAVFYILLHRYTAQEEIVIGTPTFGRSRAEYAKIIGDFINMLPIRVDLSGNPSFRKFLAQVRQVMLAALEHQDFPFSLMVERLGRSQNNNRSPLFQVSFDVQRVHQFEALSDVFVPRATGRRVDLGGLEIEAYPLPQQEGQFDLVMQILDAGTTLPAVLKYSSDIFEGATIARMVSHYKKLLESTVTDPDQRICDLPLLTDEERRQLVLDWNSTRVSYPEDTAFYRLFEAQVVRTPDATAVVYEAERLTYQELNERANRLAHYLRGQGVGPDMLVGVCLGRSPALIVTLLGIVKAGGAYLPLDPTYPKDRLAYMLDNSRAGILVTEAAFRDVLPEYAGQIVDIYADWPFIEAYSNTNIDQDVSADNLVYVIYTSGSTGRPKGIQILHRGLTNYLTWCTKAYDVEKGHGAPVHSSISFDLTVTAMFPPLVAGRAVYLLPENATAESLARMLLDNPGFSLVKITPAHLELLNNLIPAERAAGLTHAFIIGGENLLAETLAFWWRNAPETILVNEYGPTETVVGCCVYWADDDVYVSGSVPIGRPIANTELYVLDAHLNLVPIGVPGELYIGGDGLARGYLNRLDLTAERFIPHPFSSTAGARIYKTGDLARYRPDGNLEYLGRIDNQVKIRGFRIELGEIEAALSEHPAVQEAVVIVREDTPGDKRLVAYVRSAQSSGEIASELRYYMKERLPDYMVPAAYVTLDAMPLTPNGKVDRRALPPPDYLRPEHATAVVAPRTEMETMLVDVWLAVLGIDQVSIYDNFFDLGGHSLQAMQVISKMESNTGLRIDPAFMRFQTLAQLAAAYEEAETTAVPTGDTEVEDARSGKLLSNIRRLVSKKK
ncbi:MAG: amino acid adenylation domain-containing protein [Chloroflexi bacterium]|nr:amino acid adenylation domain-containing protein [Chloroflexota bacterium]